MAESDCSSNSLILGTCSALPNPVADASCLVVRVTDGVLWHISRVIARLDELPDVLLVWLVSLVDGVRIPGGSARADCCASKTASTRCDNRPRSGPSGDCASA